MKGKQLITILIIICIVVTPGCSNKNDDENGLLSTLQALQTQVAAGETDLPPSDAITGENPNKGGEEPATDPVEPMGGDSVLQSDDTDPGSFISIDGLRFLGQIGGSTYAVAVENNLAVIGVGTRLVTLDISDPSNPKHLGESQVLPGVIKDIVLMKNTVYAASDLYGGLLIIDIGNPASPTISGSFIPQSSGCNSVDLVDTVAYLGCNPYGLYIVDVSNPAKPVEKGNINLKKAILDIDVDNGFAYLVSAGDGIDIIDVRDPSSPLQAGFFAPPTRISDESTEGAYFYGLEVVNGIAYVSAGIAGMVVIEVHDTANPVLIGFFDSNASNGIQISGDIAYLVDEFEGVYLLDISNPSQPKQIGLVPSIMGTEDELSIVAPAVRHLAVEDGKLFVTDSWHSLYIHDVSGPENPYKLGHFQAPAPDRLVDTIISDGLAYLISDTGGLRILDVSTPEQMQELAFDDHRIDLYLQVPSAIAKHDHNIYISDLNSGFRIYDVENPKSPNLVGTIFDIGFVQDMVLRYPYAYLGTVDWKNDRIPKLLIVDVEDPSSPTIINTIEIPSDERQNIIWTMSEEGNYLYMLDITFDGQKGHGLYIYSIEDAANPILQGTTVIPTMFVFAGSLDVQDGIAYSGGSMSSVLLLDVSDPSKPSLKGNIPGVISGFDIDAQGKLLFTLSNVFSINEIDISDPSMTKTIGRAVLPTHAFGFFIDQDLYYLVGQDYGLYVFEKDFH